MTDGISRLLRQAISERFEGNLTWTADSLDLPVQSLSKYVHVDPALRTNPSPSSCLKIARGLGRDYDEVLELAGHRPPRTAQQKVTAWRQSVHDQVDGWLAAVGPGQEEFFWRHLRPQAEATLDLMAELSPSAVSSGNDGAISSAAERGNGAQAEKGRRGRPPLRVSYWLAKQLANLSRPVLQPA